MSRKNVTVASWSSRGVGWGGGASGCMEGGRQGRRRSSRRRVGGREE